MSPYSCETSSIAITPRIYITKKGERLLNNLKPPDAFKESNLAVKVAKLKMKMLFCVSTNPGLKPISVIKVCSPYLKTISFISHEFDDVCNKVMQSLEKEGYIVTKYHEVK